MYMCIDTHTLSESKAKCQILVFEKWVWSYQAKCIQS